MFLIVGLGNPGEKYSLNRHNIGFMALDVIATSYNFPPFRLKFQGAFTEGTLENHKVLLLKPLTFMNLSGKSVAEVCRFYKIPPENVYVIHDDLDLEEGKVKFKKGGSSGGHNGLNSIDQLSGKEYWRIRLGIGHPGHKDAVNSYVLGNFKSSEMNWVEDVLGAISAESPSLFTCSANEWLTKVNLRLRPL